MQPLPPGISVIICTYNAASRIEKALVALLAQTGTQDIAWEVILVDNAGTDGTPEIAKSSWTDSTVPFTIVHERKAGRFNAMRTGLDHARYAFAALVDDDNWVCETYIRDAYAVMIKHPTVGICGPRGVPEFESSSPEWFERFQEAFAVGPQSDQIGVISKPEAYVFGACSIIRMEGWNKIKSTGHTFIQSGRSGNSLSSGDDTELSYLMRLIGYELYYAPHISYRHFMPVSRIDWRYVERLYRAFGESSVSLDFYKKRLGAFSTVRSRAVSNWFTATAYAGYLLVQQMPGYLISLFTQPHVGNASILRTHYYLAKFLTLLFGASSFSEKKAIVDQLANQLYRHKK